MAPNAAQETLETGALDSVFDTLFDGGVTIEELAPENNDNADHQQTTAQEHGR